VKLFDEYVDKRGPEECWPWKGAATNGRAMIWHQKKVTPASQVAWSRANGKPFPKGLYGLHSCDNGMCVNPNHVWPGTQSENMRDAVAKGRQNKVKKIRCSNGHPLSVENTYTAGQKGRRCKICQAAASAKWRKSLREAVPVFKNLRAAAPAA
jgi:hypothetical protein